MGAKCTIMTEECNGAFERATTDRETIKTMVSELALKFAEVSDRLFKTNGKRALIEEILDNKKGLERLAESVSEHIANAEIAHVVPPDSQPNFTKIKLGKMELTTNSIEIASASMRILSLVAIVAFVYYGSAFLRDLRTDLMTRVEVVESKVIEEISD